MIKDYVRSYSDFPKPGIIFKDITPVLLDPSLTSDLLDALCQYYTGNKPDAIAGIESRGFLFGLMMAQKLQIPFIPIRKKGKLPRTTAALSYQLEYGSAEIEVHKEDIRPGARILIHDDLLATGGTAKATAELIELCGGSVQGFSFIIELLFLNGRSSIKGPELHSILQID